MVERIYGFPPDRVFKALLGVCSRSPFRLRRTDEHVRQLRVSTGVSLVSWGETIEILVYPHEKGSLVKVEGGAKVFFNLSANPDRRVVEIFNRLDSALSDQG